MVVSQHTLCLRANIEGVSTETGRRPAQGLYTETTGSLETSVMLVSVWW